MATVMDFSLNSIFVFSLYVLIYFSCIGAAPFETAKYLQRINLVTGEKFIKDLTLIDVPDPVPRLRLLIGISEAASSSKFVDVYRLRLRWVPPEFWNDNFRTDNRSFEIRCEIEDEDSSMTYTFLELAVDDLVTGYDENFVVRERLPLLLRCRIRAQNSYGLPSKWKQSSTLKLYKLYPNRKKAIPSPLNEVHAEHGEFKFYR